MKLSIIIPMYNAEKYISACLMSCLKQDVPYTDYEIIVVNDGSPDDSIKIAEKIATQYKNIQIVSQNNGGLSVARNNGLSIAKGDYVWFVDSDDTIADGALLEIFKGVESNVDVLSIQYRLVYDDISKNQDVCNNVVDGIKDGRYVIKKGVFAIPAPFHIYKRIFLKDNNLYFTSGKLHEDAEFKPRAIYLANTISSIDYVCYNYYKTNTCSITACHSIRNVEGYIYAAKSINDFCMHIDKSCKKSMLAHVGRSLNGAIYNYVRILDKKEKEKAKELILNSKSVFRAIMCSSSIQYITEGFLLSVAPSMFLFLYPYFKKI